MKIIKSLFIGCLSAVAIANQAFGIPLPRTDWEFVGATAQGDSLAIQVAERQGQKIGYWQRIVYLAPQVGGYTVQAVYTVGDCERSTISILWISRLTDEGKVIANGQSNNKAILPVTVNSLGSMGLSAACKKV